MVVLFVIKTSSKFSGIFCVIILYNLQTFYKCFVAFCFLLPLKNTFKDCKIGNKRVGEFKQSSYCCPFKATTLENTHKNLSVTDGIFLRFQYLVQNISDFSFLEMPPEPAALLLSILNADSSHPLRGDLIFLQRAASDLKPTLIDEMGDFALWQISEVTVFHKIVSQSNFKT